MTIHTIQQEGLGIAREGTYLHRRHRRALRGRPCRTRSCSRRARASRGRCDENSIHTPRQRGEGEERVGARCRGRTLVVEPSLRHTHRAQTGNPPPWTHYSNDTQHVRRYTQQALHRNTRTCPAATVVPLHGDLLDDKRIAKKKAFLKHESTQRARGGGEQHVPERLGIAGNRPYLQRRRLRAFRTTSTSKAGGGREK